MVGKATLPEIAGTRVAVARDLPEDGADPGGFRSFLAFLSAMG